MALNIQQFFKALQAPDALHCTYDDARRNPRGGIGFSIEAKIAFFEEMVSLAFKFGARDQLVEDRDHAQGAIPPKPARQRPDQRQSGISGSTRVASCASDSCQPR